MSYISIWEDLIPSAVVYLNNIFAVFFLSTVGNSLEILANTDICIYLMNDVCNNAFSKTVEQTGMLVTMMCCWLPYMG